MGRKLYIDTDVLVYEAAFAAQKTRYFYKDKTGDLRFDDNKSLKEYLARRNIDYKRAVASGLVTSQVELMPEKAALNIARMKLDAIKSAMKSDDAELLLSGDHNFREEFAKTKVYKGGRPPKPTHYAAVRQFYIEQFGAVTVAGIEADDAMGIATQRDPEGVICTIDKDLNGLPGFHYNWQKQLKYKVSNADSLWFFIRQLLLGDSTDNIPGVPGMGEKAADLLMEPVRGRPREAFDLVLAKYQSGPFKFRDGSMTMKDTTAYLNEQGILLWMQRKPNERWSADYFEETYLNE